MQMLLVISSKKHNGYWQHFFYNKLPLKTPHLWQRTQIRVQWSCKKKNDTSKITHYCKSWRPIWSANQQIFVFATISFVNLNSNLNSKRSSNAIHHFFCKYPRYAIKRADASENIITCKTGQNIETKGRTVAHSKGEILKIPVNPNHWGSSQFCLFLEFHILHCGLEALR